jgi:uncharacterized membrane protein YfcA
MDLGLPIGEVLLLAGVLFATGLVTGLLAGLLGIGGGGIMVPVLYEIFGIIGVNPALCFHLAVGTSLSVIIPTSLRSFFVQRQVLQSWCKPPRHPQMQNAPNRLS